MTRRQAYQHGLTDAVQGRASLLFVLIAACELSLVKAYIRGQQVGRKLIREPQLEWNDG